jgi:hypothetical protein
MDGRWKPALTECKLRVFPVNARQITNFPDAIVAYDWSPDGKQLALTRETESHDVEGRGIDGKTGAPDIQGVHTW